MKRKSIGVIGGSGFYNFLPDAEKFEVDTPFSNKPVMLSSGNVGKKTVIFLPRHGSGHSIPPHKINYKANIFAMFKSNVVRIISTCAVGSIRKKIKPGSYVVPDQFIDPAFKPITFFDGSFKVKTPNGNELSGVMHTDMTHPYCSDIQQEIFSKIEEKENVHFGGTYAKLNGPRFETKAEIEMLSRIGADLAGMTTVPELILARELGMCYGNLAIITNYAAGLQHEVTHEEVVELFKQKIDEVQDVFKEVIKSLSLDKGCTCPVR